MPKLAIRHSPEVSNPWESMVSGLTKNTQKPDFLKNGKNYPKRKHSKKSRDMPKFAIGPLTRGL